MASHKKKSAFRGQRYSRPSTKLKSQPTDTSRAVGAWEYDRSNLSTEKFNLHVVKRSANNDTLREDIFSVLSSFKSEVNFRILGQGATILSFRDYRKIVNNVSPDLTENILYSYVQNRLSNEHYSVRLGNIAVLPSLNSHSPMHYVGFMLDDRTRESLINERNLIMQECFGLDNIEDGFYPHLTIARTTSEKTAVSLGRVLMNQGFDDERITLGPARASRFIPNKYVNKPQ